MLEIGAFTLAIASLVIGIIQITGHDTKFRKYLREFSKEKENDKKIIPPTSKKNIPRNTRRSHSGINQQSKPCPSCNNSKMIIAQRSSAHPSTGSFHTIKTVMQCPVCSYTEEITSY
jgi:hypothetical protein